MSAAATTTPDRQQRWAWIGLLTRRLAATALQAVYPGDNTREELHRSPLAQPGLNVKAGTLYWRSMARN